MVFDCFEEALKIAVELEALNVTSSEKYKILDNRISATFMGKNIYVVSKSDLIQMKLEAGRDKDLMDVRELRGE